MYDHTSKENGILPNLPRRVEDLLEVFLIQVFSDLKTVGDSFS